MKNENKSNEKKDTPIILPMQEASTELKIKN
jgi:hypothetical protein